MGLFQKKGDQNTNPDQHKDNLGLFNSTKEGKSSPQSDMHDELNVLSRKMRLLEDRYSSLQKKSTLTEQNVISTNKKFNNEFKVFTEEVLELRKMIEELDNKLLLIIKELRLCGKKEEIELLKRYINLWEPVNFVTRKEVETIVKDVLEDMQNPDNE